MPVRSSKHIYVESFLMFCESSPTPPPLPFLPRNSSQCETPQQLFPLYGEHIHISPVGRVCNNSQKCRIAPVSSLLFNHYHCGGWRRHDPISTNKIWPTNISLPHCSWDCWTNTHTQRHRVAFILVNFKQARQPRSAAAAGDAPGAADAALLCSVLLLCCSAAAAGSSSIK